MFAKRRKGRVYVYYYSEGLRKALPRRQTYHLDNATDDEIEHFLTANTALQKARKSRPDAQQVPAELEPLVDEFLDHLKNNLNRQPPTLSQYEGYLRRAGILFGWPLAKWPLKGPNFPTLCRSFGYSRAAMFKMRQNILVFWYWLRDMGYVTEDLRIPKMSVNNKTTPLKHLLSPDDVLGLPLKGDLRYLALLCYFCSLRPQEAVALSTKDYAAGSNAAGLECVRVFKKAGLYHKLAVRVERQRHDNKPRAPKADSIGWVACFNEKAAKEVVRLAQTVELKYRMDTYQRRWLKQGLGITLKDLRRASLYWLGHHTKLNPVELKNHARHSNLETTTLYVRRPDSDAARGLNLDD
jgi:integrase